MNQTISKLPTLSSADVRTRGRGVSQKRTPADGGRGWLKANADVWKFEKIDKLKRMYWKKCLIIDDC